MIRPEKREQLLADLQQRTGLTITRVEVGRINFLRDTQGAALNLSSTPLASVSRAKVMRDAVVAALGIWRDARAERAGQVAPSVGPGAQWVDVWEDFQNNGGQTGYRDLYATDTDRQDAIAKIISRAGSSSPQNLIMGMVESIGGVLSDFNVAAENAVRVATYQAGLNAGLSSAQAASVGKNITVNFNRKGAATAHVGALYAFFNAAIQGTARMAETLKGPAGKKIIAGGLLLGVAQALMLAGFGPEDPPEFVRERSIIIPMPGSDKGYFTIPMPLGFHVLPNMTRIPMEAVMHGKSMSAAMLEMLGVFISAFMPTGYSGISSQTLAPTAFDPLVALLENQDWTGKPIFQEDFSSTQPTTGLSRAREGAPGWAKMFSSAVNYLSGGDEFMPGKVSPPPEVFT